MRVRGKTERRECADREEGGSSWGSTESFRALWSRLALVLDGGPIAHREQDGGTLVDLTAINEVPPRYSIERAGVDVKGVEALLRKHGVCKTKK